MLLPEEKILKGSMKKIIIFTDKYPYGRAETFLEAEMKYFCDSFEQIIIFPFQKDDCETIRITPGNVIVREPLFRNIKRKRIELLYKGIFNTSKIKIFLQEGFRSQVWKSPSKFRIWLTHFLMIRAIMSFIRKRELIRLFNETDLLFFNWGLRWSQILPFLPEDIKPKIVVRFHGSDLYENLNSDYIPWRKEQIKRISSLIAVSEAGKNYISIKYGVPQHKIFLARIGTSDYGLNPFSKTDTIRIVSCSNIVPVKRVDLIVKILKYLKIKTEWIHFGSGPLRKKVVALTKEVPGHITCQIRGEVNRGELMEFYRNISVDLFINVSCSEGVPVSVMEALSFGIPVIATNAGGTPEIVSEKNGIVIPIEFNPETVAENIERLINSDNYSNLRKGARKTWEEKCREEKLYPYFIEYLKNL